MLNRHAVHLELIRALCGSHTSGKGKKQLKWENRASSQWLMPSLRWRPKKMKRAADESPACIWGRPCMSLSRRVSVCPVSCLMGELRVRAEPWPSLRLLSVQMPPSGAWRTGWDQRTTSSRSRDPDTGERAAPTPGCLWGRAALFTAPPFFFSKVPLMGLKGRASLHRDSVQRWSDIQGHQVAKGLRPETWCRSHFICYHLYFPSLGHG